MTITHVPLKRPVGGGASAPAPATHRTPRHDRHHTHVYRTARGCWIWDCPCGGGIHDTAHALPSQGAAFVAALVHTTTNPGR